MSTRLAAAHLGAVKSETLYRETGHVSETCSHGCDHDVRTYETVEVTPTGETRTYDDGYQKTDTPLAVDATGQVYHQHRAFDTGRASWVRDGDGTNWVPSVNGLARGTNGRPLTNQTPPKMASHAPPSSETVYEFGFQSATSDGGTIFLTSHQLGMFGDYSELREFAVQALERGETVYRRTVTTFAKPEPHEGAWTRWGSPATTAVIPEDDQ